MVRHHLKIKLEEDDVARNLEFGVFKKKKRTDGSDEDFDGLANICNKLKESNEKFSEDFNF